MCHLCLREEEILLSHEVSKKGREKPHRKPSFHQPQRLAGYGGALFVLGSISCTCVPVGSRKLLKKKRKKTHTHTGQKKELKLLHPFQSVSL